MQDKVIKFGEGNYKQMKANFNNKYKNGHKNDYNNGSKCRVQEAQDTINVNERVNDKHRWSHKAERDKEEKGAKLKRGTTLSSTALHDPSILNQ